MYSSVKDAIKLFSFIDKEEELNFIANLMEIGRGLCLEEKLFNNLYYIVQTQEDFLKGVAVLKTLPKKMEVRKNNVF